MLIRAEDGNIYNLHHIYEVVLEQEEEGYSVVAHFNLEAPTEVAGARHETARLTRSTSEDEARRVMDRIMQAEGNLDLVQPAEVRAAAHTPLPGTSRAPSP